MCQLRFENNKSLKEFEQTSFVLNRGYPVEPRNGAETLIVCVTILASCKATSSL